VPEDKSPEDKPAESGDGAKKEDGAKKNSGDADPVIPAGDPQLRRAIEYFQAKPATIRAA
jgi:hypothetical protein